MKMKQGEEKAVRMPKQRECEVILGVMQQTVTGTAVGGSARRAIIRSIR